ncbi:MAG: DUF4337 domain-containing protein [Acidobacteriota bacterium]|nr:DUF4337 domain-containing protein [Acidobacteriota bacterium]
MSEISDKTQETLDQATEGGGHFTNIIAMLVALSATFMAICNVKDGNIVQGMMQAQANAVDTWSMYQSKSTKQHLAENMVDNLILQRDLGVGLDAARLTKLDGKIIEYEGKVKKYEKDKAEAEKQAHAFEKQYNDLNVHDDQFDAAEALLSVALAMYGISALTKKKWLLGVAVGFSVVGTVLGLAGFLGWTIHPDWLAKILG